MFEIHVSNLSYDTTEEELRNAFEEYGDVKSAKIAADSDTGRSRGFAFVAMLDDVEATQAIEALDHADLAGRRINVRRSKDKGNRHNRDQRRRSSHDD